MVIDPSLSTYLRQISSRASSCHIASLAMFSYARFGHAELPSQTRADRFVELIGGPESLSIRAERCIPPHLYDVFGFFNINAGTLVHSGLIVDLDPNPVFASWVKPYRGDAAGIKFRPLGRVLALAKRTSPVRFPVETIDARLRALGFHETERPVPREE